MSPRDSDPTRLLARNGGYTSSRSHAIDDAEAIPSVIQKTYSDDARKRQSENRERAEAELATRLEHIEAELAAARRFMRDHKLASRETYRDQDRARLAVQRIVTRYSRR